MRITTPLLAAAFACAAALTSFAQRSGAAEIGPSLQTKLSTMQPTDTELVLITFNTAVGLQQGHLDVLANLGIAAPATSQLPNLGMVAGYLTPTQINALAVEPSVLSVWANDPLHFTDDQTKILCGVDKLRNDPALTAQNGGNIVNGGVLAPTAGQPNKPAFSVVVIDSGIDTQNVDLPFGAASSQAGVIPNTKVVQNVQVNSSQGEEGIFTFEENVVNNDTVGHGTHCSGTVGGTGRFSRTTAATSGPNGRANDPAVGDFFDYSGVAGGIKTVNGTVQDDGVRIVGCGSGAGLFILSATGGFEYAIANQMKYNVRVTSNSYGSNGPFNPNDPLNVAIKKAYDRNITNVFAAGNDGPAGNTISNSSKSPFVISVAAGTKEGGLASFSSRGVPASERTPGSVEEFNLNTITAPGTGREFDFNGPGTIEEPNQNPNSRNFTSDVISTGANTGTAAGGTGFRGTNDQEFPTPYQATYTQISGTSMACPFIAGTVAVLLDADPTLTPDRFHPQATNGRGVKEILQATATAVPGFADFEVGAGYVNVHAAVDEAFNPSKPYEPLTFRDPEEFITKITRTTLPPTDNTAEFPPAAVAVNPTGEEGFAMPYNPNSVPAGNRDQARAKAVAYPNNNAYAFTVVPDPGTGLPPTIIDVRIQFGQTPQTEEGNSLGLFLWDPEGRFYSSGLALPVLDSPNRQVVVKNPPLGVWVAELRPVRGLTAVPVTPPVGGALPDNTTGQVFRTNLTVADPGDIAEVDQRDAIRFALANRYLDVFSDGLFQPTAKVTRGDFVKTLALNTPLRQVLRSAQPRFVDVDLKTSRIAEAASQNGSTLRDFDFTPGPTLPVSASTKLSPGIALSRAQIAVSLVRALGLDREAQALRGIPEVTAEFPAGSGKRVRVEDITPFNPAEPGANTQNGYLQLAINRGLMTIRAAQQPDQSVKVFADPTRPMIRANLAVVINNFRTIFGSGNELAADELPTGDSPEDP